MYTKRAMQLTHVVKIHGDSTALLQMMEQFNRAVNWLGNYPLHTPKGRQALNRYLAESEKERRVKEWLEARSRWYVCSPGNPDPEIFWLTDALNALSGICTLQSCSGHMLNGFVQSGSLWVKLSNGVMSQFYKAAPVLARQDVVEDVSIRFGTGEGEIVEIVFKGNERGLLRESESVILSFFKSVSGGAKTPPLT